MLEGLALSKGNDKNKDTEDNQSNIVIAKRPIKAINRKTHKQRRKERLTRLAVCDSKCSFMKGG